MNQDKEQMMRNALPKGAILNSGKIEYRIEDVLGAGGFGITYRASANINIGHITKRFDFAIKEHFMKGCYRGDDKKIVLCPDSIKQEVEQSRTDFESEAKRLYELGRLSQHIVKVNESFKANGTFYYVMEYLEGGDLEKYVRKNKSPLSEADAVALLVPIARAVDLLHSGEKPLLHLDIKPDNIVMKRDEVSGLQIPVLIDFGAAKHFNKSGKPTSLLVAKAATPGYAPIEQYGPIPEFDARLDVYALGATLFFLLTGKRPPEAFEISSSTQISSLLPSTLSPRIAAAVVGALRKDKHERTPNVKAFIDQIEKLGKLPLYYELKTGTGKYTITEILEGTEKSISYRAVPTSNNIYDENATVANSNYKITEFFDRNECKRNEDYSVSNVNKNSERYIDFIAEIKSKTQLFSITESNTSSNVNRTQEGFMKDEICFCNGTCYLISRIENSRPPIPAIPVKKILKYVGIFVATAAVVFVAVKLINSPKPVVNPYEDALAILEKGDTLTAVKSFVNLPNEYKDSAQNIVDDIIKHIGENEKTVINNILKDPTLKVDLEQLKIAGQNYQRLQKYKSDYASLGYELDFIDVEAKIEKEVAGWLRAADDSPVPTAQKFCYECIMALRPDSTIQAKLDKLK